VVWSVQETPSASWVSETPVSGSVPAGGSGGLSATLTASLPSGTKTTTLRFRTDFSPTAQILVPVQLTVLGPVMDVEPDSLSSTLLLGQSEVQALTVSNTGPVDLVFTASDNATWLTLAPTSGTVPPQGALGVDVTINAATLGSGVYNASITFQDNDSATPNLVIPVQLTVLGPVMEVAPRSLAATLDLDQTEVQVLTVSNTGPANLIFSATDDASWLTVAPGSGEVPPRGSLEVDVTFDATGLSPAAHQATITFQDNDSGTPPFYVPVTLLVTWLPDIGVGEDAPVVLESVATYSTTGAATSHAFAIDAEPSGGGSITVIAEGDFEARVKWPTSSSRARGSAC
jgi:hypothetical protein